MVAKKRKTLRQRFVMANSTSIEANDSPRHTKMDTDMSGDHKPYLHRHKESKVERNLNRQQAFLDQIKQKNGTDSTLAGISKSAIRRRRRKLKEELKPNMGELLTSLDQDDHDLEEGVIERHPQKKRKNQPNIRNQRGARALSIQESERMKQVLTNTSFRQNTFGALRDVIKMQNR